MEIPEEERGAMRTYTVRALRGTGADTRLVVDFVIHGEGDESGPGGDWGAHAAVGQRVITMAPRRGVPFGGIEFAPGTAKRLLLVGDETAVPAVAAVLECLPATSRGAVFLEVPVAADVLPLDCPSGVEVHWLPRDGAPRSVALHAAVLEHLGEEPTAPVVDEVDPDLWETPTYSSSGEDVDTAVRAVGHEYDDLYAWIAGESEDGDRPAPGPGQGPGHRPAPGGLHGLLAGRRRDALLTRHVRRRVGRRPGAVAPRAGAGWGR